MKNVRLAKKIKVMAEMDQRARKSAAPYKKGFENLLVYTVDGIHNKYIHQIIDEHGYPMERTIGREGIKKFWLLVQHQDSDVALQKACLKKCDFAPKERAYLTDRVLVSEGKKQKYGTQMKRVAAGFLVPRTIEKGRGVDVRRKQAGLGTLEEYIRLANKRFNKKLRKKN